MKNKEMTEIFSVMLLAWPNAEVFKGGIAGLKPTIQLWTACTADVDYWTGQQAVIRLCKSCKFPPTISEFRQQAHEVNQCIQTITEQTIAEIKNADFMYGSIAEYFQQLPQGDFIREVITAMGGPDILITTVTQNDRPISMWNIQGLQEACRTVIQGRPTLVGGKPPALPSRKYQEGI